MKGHLAGMSLTRGERWHWGDLWVDLLETVLCSRAAARLISGGEEVSLRAAIRCRCSINRGWDGRQASMAKMGIGVEESNW